MFPQTHICFHNLFVKNWNLTEILISRNIFELTKKFNLTENTDLTENFDFTNNFDIWEIFNLKEYFDFTENSNRLHIAKKQRIHSHEKMICEINSLSISFLKYVTAFTNLLTKTVIWQKFWFHRKYGFDEKFRFHRKLRLQWNFDLTENFDFTENFSLTENSTN